MEASRELSVYRATLAASGGLKRSDHHKYERQLERAARGERRRARKASPAELEALGVRTTEATPEILEAWGLKGGEA
jgi:hypothetical protein